MRFSIVTVFGLAAFVTAESSSASITSHSLSIVSSTSIAASSSISLSPEQICLANCGGADICCQAKCVNVPCPSQLQANATTECAAQCPQGDGSQAETNQYAACQSRCVSSYFFSTGTAAAAATGVSSSGASATFGATATGSGSATRSGSSTAASTAQATHNAAPEIRFGAAGAGLMGLFALGLAL